MATQQATEISTEYAGCWLDSARGIYIGETIQEIATQYGWIGQPLDVNDEFYFDAICEAEEYLNGLAPEGYFFGTNESGDWGLWEIQSVEFAQAPHITHQLEQG